MITIELPAKVPVFVDKKTGVQTMALNFTFPNLTGGILSITKLSKLPWQPNLDIKSITINYHDDKTA